MSNLTIEQDVVAYMAKAVSESDWNDRCDAVKSANNGYPSFWYEAIVMSGVMASTARKWR
jgi:hypothetical protein